LEEQDMSEPEIDLHALWDTFLKEWPVERIRTMTLEEYTNANRSDAFVYWMEQVAEQLGSIGGGSAFKWGIYHRSPGASAPGQAGTLSDETYSWYSRYGDTAADAFETILTRLNAVIDAAAVGDLDEVERLYVGWPIYKWKVAFIYQDRRDISLLPVYREAWLRSHYERIEPDADPKATRAQMYPVLLEHYATLGDVFDIATYIYTHEDGPDPAPGSSPQGPTGHTLRPTARILYGPPGTGKTWATTHAALELTHPCEDTTSWSPEERKQTFEALRRRGQVGFVTFHPSYGYEDFIESIRPTLHPDQSSSGEVGYELAHGVFKRMALDALAAGMVRSEHASPERARFSAADAQRALDDPDPDARRFVFGPETDQFVLIIDEINRGNVSSIFGELMTLLEPSRRLGMPDETRLRLATSPGHTFALPPNLHVVATMNTTDRSIALMDTALRRRFTFVEVMPSLHVLAQGLAGTDDLAHVTGRDHRLTLGLFASLNERISLLYDRDHQLGHAYFMSARSPLELAEVVSTNVVPLLQEYFYGSWERVCDALGCPYDERGSSRRGLDPGLALVTCHAVSMADVLGYEPDFDAPARLEYRVSRLLGTRDSDALRAAFDAALTDSWRAYHRSGEVPAHVLEGRG
jgi:hypothetical protein